RKIKSPTEYIVGAVWALTDRLIQQGSLINQLEAMGQALFAPPNVKGWPGGTAWLNTSTILARHNFAHAVAAGNLRDTNRYNRLPRPGEALEREREAAEEQRRLVEEARRAEEEARLKAEGKPIPPRPEPKTPPLPPPPANMDVAALVRHDKATTPEAIVRVLVDLLLQGGISNGSRAKLVAFVREGNPKDAAL